MMDGKVVAIALTESVALSRRTRVLTGMASEYVAHNHAWIREQASRNASRSRRMMIREKLRDGRLPSSREPIMQGLPGTGGHCAACETVISPSELAMTIWSGPERERERERESGFLPPRRLLQGVGAPTRLALAIR